MSMTREEAIEVLQEKHRECKSFYDLAAHPEEVYPETTKFLFALELALSALRPVSREQVEKVWRGEWKMEEAQEFRCSVCGAKITYYGHPDKFCADCGSAMTDEAVEMVMERMEEMKNGTVPCDNA